MLSHVGSFRFCRLASGIGLVVAVAAYCNGLSDSRPHGAQSIAAEAPDDAASAAPASRPLTPTADEALELLTAGNRRYVAAGLQHPRQSPADREALVKGQRPYAIVLGCADSRVPPEIVFDAGLGDLFDVRVAGNIADDASLGSMEYGVEHLHAPLIVVLGHERCGAVSTAVDVVTTGASVPGHIGSVVSPIEPAVKRVKDAAGNLLDNAIRENVREVVQAIKESKPILAHEIEEGKLKVVGAYYSLETGKVELVDAAK